MIEFLLDTDICIYAMKGRPKALAARLDRHLGRLGISAVVLAELSAGIEKSELVARNRATLAAFLGLVEVLPFDRQAAEDYGALRATLERAGTPIGPLDLLIGAHARSLSLTLVTNNRREFDRVPGLKVETWAA